jgi:hypothetical protein
MRPCSLRLLLVEDENGKLQNGDLSASQQRHSAGASRRTRISGWHLCSPDGLTRGSGGNGASTSGTTKNASRRSSPEARHVRGLTLADRAPRWGRALGSNLIGRGKAAFGFRPALPPSPRYHRARRGHCGPRLTQPGSFDETLVAGVHRRDRG